MERTGEIAADRLSSLGDDSSVDADVLYSLLKFTAFGGKGVDRVVKEELWPIALSRFQVEEATTNIDGKYEFKNLKGVYYLHAACY